MEVGRVKGFNKGKSKKGGKGKPYGKDDKGKGKGKSDGKSKGKQNDTYKGKGFKGYGKQDGQGKGKGGLAYDACKLCGGKGHWSRECPVRSLRQVAKENEIPAASSGAGVQSSAQSSTTGTSTVRRVQIIDLDDMDEPDGEASIRMVSAEEFDMTYSDDDKDWEVCENGEAGGDAYFETFMDLDYNVEKHMELGSRPTQRAFVRNVNMEEFVDVILDSGADVSVLPMAYSGIGQPLTGKSILRDAQGRKMGGGELRRAVVVLQDGQGNEVAFVPGQKGTVCGHLELQELPGQQRSGGSLGLPLQAHHHLQEPRLGDCGGS